MSSAHFRFLPQSELAACLRRARLSCLLITPAAENLLRACSIAFTYSPWFFHGASHGASCSMLQPCASTTAPCDVFGHRSTLSGTPSPRPFCLFPPHVFKA